MANFFSEKFFIISFEFYAFIDYKKILMWSSLFSNIYLILLEKIISKTFLYLLLH